MNVGTSVHNIYYDIPFSIKTYSAKDFNIGDTVSTNGYTKYTVEKVDKNILHIAKGTHIVGIPYTSLIDLEVHHKEPTVLYTLEEPNN